MSLRKKKREMSISSRFCSNFSFEKLCLFLSWLKKQFRFCFLQKTSPSVVYIEAIELPKTSSGEFSDEENAKIEGTGSGFVWDKLGHIVGKTFLSVMFLCSESWKK